MLNNLKANMAPRLTTATWNQPIVPTMPGNGVFPAVGSDGLPQQSTPKKEPRQKEYIDEQLQGSPVKKGHFDLHQMSKMVNHLSYNLMTPSQRHSYSHGPAHSITNQGQGHKPGRYWSIQSHKPSYSIEPLHTNLSPGQILDIGDPQLTSTPAKGHPNLMAQTTAISDSDVLKPREVTRILIPKSKTLSDSAIAMTVSGPDNGQFISCSDIIHYNSPSPWKNGKDALSILMPTSVNKSQTAQENVTLPFQSTSDVKVQPKPTKQMPLETSSWENTIVQRQRQEIQRLICELRDRDGELNAIVASHQTQLLAWEEDRQRILTLEQKCGRYQGELRDKTQDIDRITAEMNAVRSKEHLHTSVLEKTQERLARMNHAKQQQGDKLQHLEDTNSSLNDSMRDISSNVGHLEAKTEELTTVIRLKDKDLIECSSLLSEMGNRLQQLESRCKECQQREAQAINQSTEWREKYREMKEQVDSVKGDHLTKITLLEQKATELEHLHFQFGLCQKELILSVDREQCKYELLSSLRCRQERMETELKTLRELNVRQHRELALLHLNLDSSQEKLAQQQASWEQHSGNLSDTHQNCSDTRDSIQPNDSHQQVSESEEIQSNCSKGSNSRVDQSSLITSKSKELDSHDVSGEQSKHGSKSGYNDDRYSREKSNNSSANNLNYSTESCSRTEHNESSYSEVESRSEVKQRFYSGTDSNNIPEARTLESKMRSPRQSISEINGDVPQGSHHDTRQPQWRDHSQGPGIYSDLGLFDRRLLSTGNKDASSSRHQNLDIVNPSTASPRPFDLKLNSFLTDSEEDVNSMDFLNQTESSPASKLQRLLTESRQMIECLEKTAVPHTANQMVNESSNVRKPRHKHVAKHN